MEKKKIICDTDLGDDIDDAYTLVQLMYERDLDLLGITSVYRNAMKRAENISGLIELCNRDIPVYVGESFPSVEALRDFPWVEKDENNVCGIPYCFEKTSDIHIQKQSAIDFILETLNKYPGEVMLLAIGPLTNLASAYRKDSESFRKTKEILLMGGNYSEQKPEWNIACDPEAAKEVFSSGVPIKAVGIDTTRSCVFGTDEMEVLNSLNSELCRELNRVTVEWIEQNKSFKVSPTMHDVLAASDLFYPVCKFKKARIKVETEGTLRGCTLIDNDGDLVEIAVEADQKRLIGYQIECLKKFDEKRSNIDEKGSYII